MSDSPPSPNAGNIYAPSRGPLEPLSDGVRDSRPLEGSWPKLFKAGLTAGVHLFATICVSYWLSSMSPLIHYYEANDTPLPSITQYYLILYLTALNYGYLFGAAMIFLNGPLALALQYLPPSRRWLRVCWFDGYLILLLAVMALGSVAMTAPLHTVIEAGAAP